MNPKLFELDKTIHEKGRLAIMTLLASKPSRSFQELKQQLQMTDGNLITHLRTLHQAGYVAFIKVVDGRTQTSYALTDKGRSAFQQYLSALEGIIQLGRG